ncbi:MAG: sulfotransferase [Phycisphaerales bacterium]|nr:sulfotransferase [Planctomycetota bacterium]MCH8508301.1 sulfotransferase [Phycisphaerales bacterium]
MSQRTPNASQADALLKAGRFTEAAAAFRKLAASSPGNLSYQRAHATALLHSGKAKDARAVLRRGLRVSPRNHEMLTELAQAHLVLEELEQAEEASRRAMEARPGDANARMVRATVLRATGRYDEAYELVGGAVAGGTGHVPTVQLFLELCLWRGEIAPGIDAARRVLGGMSGGGVNERRVRLAYAQLLEKDGRYDEAFAQYERVNRMRGGAAGFDADAFERLVERVRVAWTPEALAEFGDGAASQGDELAVLIVGMPRSGSSLIERVLDRHPEVSAGGELPAMHEAVVEAVPGVEQPVPGGAGLAVVAEPSLLGRRRAERLRRSYLRALRKRAARSARVTDKSLSNFLHLGPVRAAMPGATVVHCVRDPLDTCLSCFCQDFASPMPFTEDLESLGRFYNGYRRLMAHWDAVAPVSAEVVYERVVEDLEGEAQKVIEAAGLDWDDACARPQEGGGYTGTASRDQVRRKVYRSSVGRWKRFEKHIGPLLDAVDDRYLADGAAG